MLRLLMLLPLLIACSEPQSVFADKRFDQTFIAGSKRTSNMTLYADKISFGGNNGYFPSYFLDCTILENKIGLLKYSCKSSKYCESYDTCNEPAVQEKYEQIIVIKILEGEEANEYGIHSDAVAEYYENGKLYTSYPYVFSEDIK